MVSICSKRVFLDDEVQRLECRRCGYIRLEKLGFADTMKQMACGFRDMEFFKLKIMALHEQKTLSSDELFLFILMMNHGYSRQGRAPFGK